MVELSRVLLLHWNDEEAVERVSRIRAVGFEADTVPLEMPATFRQLRENPPSALVIDLSRLPSAGRDVALSLRTYKATRHVPIVFVEGDPAKVGLIKKLLPDAVYSEWDKIGSSLRHAIAHPPAEPVVPRSRLAGYSEVPLPEKLGIKRRTVVSLVNAPPGFEKLLGKLSEDVIIQRNTHPGSDIVVWFVLSRKELKARIRNMVHLASKGGLWIAWPKKGAGQKNDLSQAEVRTAGLAAGLVDYKISSFDSTWSGLKFTSRRPKGQRSRSNILRR